MLTIVGQEDLEFSSEDQEAIRLVDAICKERSTLPGFTGFYTGGKNNDNEKTHRLKRELKEQNNKFDESQKDKEYQEYLRLKEKFDK